MPESKKANKTAKAKVKSRAAGRAKSDVYERLDRKPRKEKVEKKPTRKRIKSGRWVRRLKLADNPWEAPSKIGKNATKALALRRALTAQKKARDLQKKGTYKRAITWIELTLHAKMAVYDGGKLLDSYPVETKEYYGIRWNQNNESTWRAKIQEAQTEMYEKFIQVVESGTDVEEYSFTKSTALTKRDMNKVVRDPKKIRMLGVFAVPIHYAFIPAEVNPQIPGHCGDEWLIELLKPKVPTICQETLDSIMGKLNPELGRSPEELDKVCARYNMSHYALDYKHKVFFKVVRTGRNHPPLMYYSISNHMYPVTNPSTCESIRKKSAAKKSTTGTNLQASQNEKQQVEAEKKTINDFEQMLMLEDIWDPEDIMSLEDCNIFYHTHSLRELYMKLFVHKKTAYETRHLGHNMVQIIIAENNVKLFANMNHRTSNPLKKQLNKTKVTSSVPGFRESHVRKEVIHTAYDWNDVKVECGAFNTPFCNQSFTALAKQVQAHSDYKGKKKCLRVQVTPAVRKRLLEKQSFKCVTCRDKIDATNSDTDHKIPLEQYGTNEFENLQQLCKKCHDEKTRREAARRAFDTDNTQSDYNEDTLEIFKKAKNGFINNFDSEKHWQHRSKHGITHLFGLDICKTRTEIALRNKDPFMVFSIFDQVHAFDVLKHTRKGGMLHPCVARVVTNNYIPFKGTGWYSYPLVNKALAEGLIKLSDITHCVKPSFLLPADYYVPFIETVREKLVNKNLAKLMVNMFIGSLGHKISKHRKLFLTDSLNEATYHKFCCAEDDNNRVHVHESKDVAGLYEVVTVREQYCESSHVPIFNQILDEEAWQMYEIVKLMKKHATMVFSDGLSPAQFSGLQHTHEFNKDSWKPLFISDKTYDKTQTSYSRQDAPMQFTISEPQIV